MSEINRFGVSIPNSLLTNFDQLIQQKGYENRSEAIRDLIRDRLVKQEWEANKETVGAITIVYNHHTRELSKVLTTTCNTNFIKRSFRLFTSTSINTIV